MQNSSTPQLDGFSQIAIAPPVRLLTFIPLGVLLVFALFVAILLSRTTQSLETVHQHQQGIAQLEGLKANIDQGFIGTLMRVHTGTLSWEQGRKTLAATDAAAAKTWDGFIQSESDDERKREFAEAQSTFREAAAAGAKLMEKEDHAGLARFLSRDMDALLQPLRTALLNQLTEKQKESGASFDKALADSSGGLMLAIIAVFVAGIATAASGHLSGRALGSRVGHLKGVVGEWAQGRMEARVALSGDDEIAQLGNALNLLVNERHRLAHQLDSEHQTLNESVIALVRAVMELSERNLTVRAQVTEDITGPLADAINQMAEDTADVLRQVRDIANSVQQSTQAVNQHVQSVTVLAEVERSEADETMQQLREVLQHLTAVADSAGATNQMAEDTSKSTEQTHRLVEGMLDNMTGVRQTVQETSKRIKRLGERSQEISHITDIISGITERTTMLALNASMQAAAAGEAGRGFSVIAEEIQRLAESSRESTEQISSLVRNIQQETNSTIATMDRTVEQVVAGSALAEDASRQMQETLGSTMQLAESVGHIAHASREQESINNALRTSAERILEATRATGTELLSLGKLTQGLAEAGKRLTHSVNIFRLES